MEKTLSGLRSSARGRARAARGRARAPQTLGSGGGRAAGDRPGEELGKGNAAHCLPAWPDGWNPRGAC